MKTKDKKTLFAFLLILGIASIISAFIILPRLDYMVEENRECITLDKYQTSAGYKVEGKFILVLRDIRTNKIFDITVTPSTYSQAKIGKHITFILSEYDVNPTDEKSRNNFLVFVLPIAIGIILAVVSIIVLLEMYCENNLL